MICPYCATTGTRVVDSRNAGNSVRRRRACDACERRFTTHERVELRLPAVVKKSGNREPFDRNKVYAGLALACRKRPVSEAQLEAATDRVEARASAFGERELPSQEIGQMVLEELRDIDRVAWLRFVSVYQEFSSPQEFLALLQPLLGEEESV